MALSSVLPVPFTDTAEGDICHFLDDEDYILLPQLIEHVSTSSNNAEGKAQSPLLASF